MPAQIPVVLVVLVALACKVVPQAVRVRVQLVLLGRMVPASEAVQLDTVLANKGSAQPEVVQAQVVLDIPEQAPLADHRAEGQTEVAGCLLVA